MSSKRFLTYSELLDRFTVLSPFELDYIHESLELDTSNESQTQKSILRYVDLPSQIYDEYIRRFEESYDSKNENIDFFEEPFLSRVSNILQQGFQMGGAPYAVTHCFSFTQVLTSPDIDVLRKDYKQLDFMFSDGSKSQTLRIFYLNEPQRMLEAIWQVDTNTFEQLINLFLSNALLPLIKLEGDLFTEIYEGEKYNIASLSLNFFMSELFNLVNYNSEASNSKMGEWTSPPKVDSFLSVV